MIEWGFENQNVPPCYRYHQSWDCLSVMLTKSIFYFIFIIFPFYNAFEGRRVARDDNFALFWQTGVWGSFILLILKRWKEEGGIPVGEGLVSVAVEKICPFLFSLLFLFLFFFLYHPHVFLQSVGNLMCLCPRGELGGGKVDPSWKSVYRFFRTFSIFVCDYGH